MPGQQVQRVLVLGQQPARNVGNGVVDGAQQGAVQRDGEAKHH